VAAPRGPSALIPRTDGHVPCGAEAQARPAWAFTREFDGRPDDSARFGVVRPGCYIPLLQLREVGSAEGPARWAVRMRRCAPADGPVCACRLGESRMLSSRVQWHAFAMGHESGFRWKRDSASSKRSGGGPD
jgi:hypothetical protein